MKSIRMKILAMLAILAGGAIISAFISLYGLHRADDLNTRSEIQGQVALLTQRINGLVTAVVMDSRGIYMSKTSKDAAPFVKGVEDRFPTLRKFSDELQKITPAEESETVGRIAKAVDDFIAFRSETARLGREVSPEAANVQGNNEANRANRKALNDLLIGFSQRIEKAGAIVGDEATAFTRQVQWLMPLVLLATLVISIGVALVFAQRSITRPILDLGKVMEKLTAGDIRVDVPHTGRPDEIGAMARAVAVLRQSTEQVALLQEQEVELYIGPEIPNLTEFQFEPILQDRLAACVPADFDHGAQELTLAELSHFPLIMLDRQTAIRTLIDRIVAEGSIRLNIQYEVQNAYTAIALASAGLGVAIVPSIAIPMLPSAEFRVVPISDAAAMRAVGILTARGYVHNSYSEQLIELIRTEMRKP